MKRRLAKTVALVPAITEMPPGLAVLYRGVRVSCTQILRTPEFLERDRITQFGSFNVTFHY